ncbi:transposable element Tcb2 transposase [Trichonephila clavipes]|nr:transposable element Tcb2 transposase [Trichonephila clavipes]
MQVAGRNHHPTNRNTLIRALTEERDKFPQQLLDNVVQSMVRRVECCITLNGGHIPDVVLKMAPKTKEISLDKRKHIIELHKEGKSFREIGKILKLSFTIIGYIVKKYLETGSVENKPRPGGPSKLTSRAKRMIVRSATNKPMTSPQNIANELLSSCNVSLSAQTVRNLLHSTGLKARIPRKKPYISEVNRKRRLEFVKKYKNKPVYFWKKVIFSDKSKFDIFTSPSIRKIWIKNKTALEPKNVLFILKHGGGKVMVWGCVAHNGANNLVFIDNKMNVSAYIDVLRHNLLDSAKKLSMENTFIFQ